jgi:uncharacterized membrane protein
MLKNRKKFWNGFAAGAAAGVAAGVGTLIAVNRMGQERHGRILRFEKSIQIGKPVEEVFNNWVDFERLPQLCDTVKDVSRHGNRSHWKVEVDGRPLEWDAEIEQFIPNQAVGWKSVHGPKHTGRINFSPLGADTLVHVTMNYAPPSALLRPFVVPMTGPLQSFIEHALREFKASLEGKGQEHKIGEPLHSTGRISPGPIPEAARGTGTFGTGSLTDTSRQTQHSGYGGQHNPVEYTRPPESKT